MCMQSFMILSYNMPLSVTAYAQRHLKSFAYIVPLPWGWLRRGVGVHWLATSSESLTSKLSSYGWLTWDLNNLLWNNSSINNLVYDHNEFCIQCSKQNKNYRNTYSPSRSNTQTAPWWYSEKLKIHWLSNHEVTPWSNFPVQEYLLPMSYV